MSDNFSIDGIQDLANALGGFNDPIVNKRVKQFLQKEGNKLRNETKSIARAKVKKKTGNYLKRIKRGKVYLYQGDTWAIRAYSTAPHAHLIEDGHNIVRGGEIVGHVTGKKIFQSAERKFSEDYFKDVEQFVDDVLDEGLGF